jgi:lipooligosaccharide transport system permease protein
VSAPTTAGGVRSALGYWLVRYRRTWRGTVVISVANPALFLTALGLGLGRLVDARHSHYLGGVTYLEFLAPGLLAAAVMQTAYVEAAGPVHMAARAAGAYRIAVASPLRPAELYAGHLAFMAGRVLTSSAAFTLVALAFGAVPASGVGPLIAAATLTGLAFAAPVAAWAVTVDRPAVLTAGFRFVIMPMYMFAGTFFAVGQLPGWLQVIARATPLYQGVGLCRTAAGVGSAGPATAGHGAYLLVLIVAGSVVARRTYPRVLTA